MESNVFFDAFHNGTPWKQRFFRCLICLCETILAAGPQGSCLQQLDALHAINEKHCMQRISFFSSRIISPLEDRRQQVKQQTSEPPSPSHPPHHQVQPPGAKPRVVNMVLVPDQPLNEQSTHSCSTQQIIPGYQDSALTDSPGLHRAENPQKRAPYEICALM